jgi:glycosyltransferase involved in cell wall biosynthesis
VKDNRFVFVTPAYNCEDDIAQTLHSMMAQSNKNWRAIIINDISTDKTLEIIKKVASGTVFSDRFTIVDNTEKMGEVSNTLQAVNQIDDDEIICRVDGGDWLTENDTLWMLDSVYKNDAVDIVWTSHRWAYTSQNISGQLSLKKDQTVYQHPWVSSHMKTFRCKRIRSVPDANFRDENGSYITIACDQAIFLPMMQMSINEKRLVGHLPTVCYHYSIDLHDKNLFTSDRSIKQKNSAEWIRARGFVR